jgi:hypothetical protein
MIGFDAQDKHYQYLDVKRHWCPRSEAFTGGDALVTFLHNGWELAGDVAYEEEWRAGRPVSIYFFPLARHGEHVLMPVIVNPYVEYVVVSLEARMVPTARQARKDMQRRQQERELRQA